MTTASAARRFVLLALLVRGASSGGLPSAGQDSPTPQPPENLERYRQFALQHDGDAARGGKLFLDEQRLACTKCHSTDGQSGKAGPDLFAVGDQFARRDLIEAILQPSAVIADGYGTTVIETASGEQHQGVLKQATDAWIELAGADGQRTRIPKPAVRDQRGSSVSLMPEGLQAGLSLPEFADLIEYLVSLKEPAHARTSHRGMPDQIPALDPPVGLRPLFDEPLRVPRAAARAQGTIQTGLVWFAQMPGLPNLFLAVDQAGMIWRLEKTPAGARRSVFADFTAEVFSASGPNGLLGLAFHPRFPQNRKYYLKHQIFEAGRIATVLVEKLAAADFHADSGRPSRRLLKIVAVAEHHNGGCIQFGPDGFLYLGMGDSAPNHDPQGHGQDLRRLPGKMLRLDVDHADAGREYGIPADNPFRKQAGARPEIWAWGFREPWRFSFDPATGDLWVADLGQERGDEVDIVRRGENYGWNVYQGFELFSNQHRREGVAYAPPLFVSRRKHGSAIVGGRVYRGEADPSFHGVYVFGDYNSRRIWGLTQQNGSLKTIRQLATSPQSITALTADEAGNLYVVGQQGIIYQIDFRGTRFDETAAPVSQATTK